MYYLQSRYYSPEWGRFLNADAFVSTGQGLLGNNMFAYCRNNPVKRIDVTGWYDLDCDDVNPIDDEITHDEGYVEIFSRYCELEFQSAQMEEKT